MSFAEIVIYLLSGFSIFVFVALLCIDIFGIRRKQGDDTRSTGYDPKVLVIVPCRGMDLTLEKNLNSLNYQKYKNYKLVAVVDDKNDAALRIIRKLHIHHLISSPLYKNCSGKVCAISTALEKFRDYDAYVIADSDILVDNGWLAALIAPLYDKHTGLSTMYPYFMPLSGFWSKVKMIWGFVGDSLLERESSRFGWGGSLAFRKDLMDKKAMDFLRNSKFSVSDDICITKIAKSKKLRIAYVPEPKPVVNCNDSFTTFTEWANRQTALTLLGYRKNLYFGLAYYTAEAWIIISGILLSVFISPLFLVFFVHYIKNVAMVYSRSRSHYWEIPLIAAMLPFIYDINLIMASRMKNITWRGRRYKLDNA